MNSFYLTAPEALRYEKLERDICINAYSKDAPPVFSGHYWLEGLTLFVQSRSVVCLDYSTAKGGSLVAYRWDGENEIDGRHFVQVK